MEAGQGRTWLADDDQVTIDARCGPWSVGSVSGRVLGS
jgi:hypothetical protein